MTALYDEEIPTFNLRHDARKGAINEGIQRWISDEVVCNVDLKSFMRGNWWCEGMEDVGKGRKSSRAQLAT